MKLLIITQKVDKDDPILGFFHRWIEEFAKHFESITVICLYKGEYNFPTNVRVFSLGKEDNVSRFKYLVRFYQYIFHERRNYDMVFVHMNPVYVVLGGVPWRFFRKRIGLWYAHKSVDIKLRVAVFLAHDIFTPSEKSFRLSTRKKHVLGHGIDTKLFSPTGNENSPSIILSVGRISQVKNYETLIKSARILKESSVSCVVHIAGVPVTNEDRVYERALRDMIHTLGLSQMIVFIGAISRGDMARKLHDAFVFVNMSRTGSLDKAVLEAMASGIPVLTSNEAFADILGSDTNMLMFQSARELAEKIVRIRDMSQGERDKLANRLRHIIAEKHDINTLIPRILSFYATSK